ncbi:putative RNA-binding protein [Seiridium unicorne]|uniref:RNA-binding protein n=1 Tax=Seiridium unicorne TaxID=138068 RepID=A0ABR2VB25_9PEZI
MYDDRDHRSHDRDERDRYQRRSPHSRDYQYRSRHDSSRSPRRNREDAYRSERQGHAYSEYPERNNGARYDRDRDYHSNDAGYGESRYGREARSSDRGRNRDYSDRYDERDYGRYSPRERSRSNSPADGHYRDGGYRSGPGRPYHTIKMDDIPGDMNAQDIEETLRNLGAQGLTDLRVKADDRSSEQRCYGFAEFNSEEASMAFLERNYPALEFTAADGSHVHVPIAYSRERRPAPKSDDWQCTMCHFENFSRRATCKQCQAPRPSEDAADMQLDGKSDECPQQTASQFLVIRNLPPSISETVFANGIKKLYLAKDEEPKQPAGAPLKLKSTAPVGNTSGLGAKPGSLARVFVIRDRYSDASCRYGFAEFSHIDDARAAMAKFNATPQFTIGSKPVTVAYIHSGVFIPYLKPVITEQDIKFTFSASHNPSLRLSYWNPTVYASELTIFNEDLYEEKPAQKSTTESTALAKDSKKRKADKDLTAPPGKKSVAMAPQLAKWADKHAELHGGGSKGAKNILVPGEQSTPATGSNSLGGRMTASSTPAITISYADLDRMCCLLCRRKFISEPSLRWHEQLSDLHKKNLDDESLILKATQDLKDVGKEPVSNYRDRAKERRTAHRQPNKPKQAPVRKHNAPTKENESKDAAPSKPAMSKGAGLLAKMGWNNGAGLGAEGEGRTNIIETMAYTPGVGLGAEGGKIGDAVEEAARATKNDYADFVAKAKDKARQRYETMG